MWDIRCIRKMSTYQDDSTIRLPLVTFLRVYAYTFSFPWKQCSFNKINWKKILHEKLNLKSNSNINENYTWFKIYNIGIHQLPSARLTIKQCSRSIRKQMLNSSLGLTIFYTNYFRFLIFMVWISYSYYFHNLYQSRVMNSIVHWSVFCLQYNAT